MFSFSPKVTIDELVQQSMFGLLKSKTGIRAPLQIRHLEYIVAFKKEEGRIKISSILIKKKILPCFERVSEKEINFSGATKDEFLDFLRKKGARQVEDAKRILEYI